MVRFEGVALVDSLKEMSFGVGDPGVSFIAFLKKLITDACFMIVNRQRC